ncbi:recombinase RecT [Staphylococcus warneri]|uniref:recombinase RecT n=1 Tax=Staphylococcus warneri TaxID=1292 RepID=UPI001F57ECA4|nr:recombinase RecT [Staphylococcus warneri]MCI2770647.1 recombinase RecT [Staphylococcus warneri]MCI2783366.1 recombinase RecT [Staphylococcus warneri]
MATQNDFKNQITDKKENKPQQSTNPRQVASDLLERMKPEIAKALPAHMSQDRMTRIALSAVNSNPKLSEVILNNPTSFLGALMQSAQLGLEPNTNLGHSYLIPYGNIVQLQLGYLGLLELAYRSGKYQKIMAMPVYKDDFFEYQYGTDEKLNHIPAQQQTGDAVGYYAFYKLTNGGTHFVYWSRQKMNMHQQQYSKGGNVWRNNFDAMALKTVIKDVLKYAPKSIEMGEAVTSDNNNFDFRDDGDIIDVTDYETEEN